MKNFQFNKIIIIQSLSPEHEQSPLGRPGPVLYDTIKRILDDLKLAHVIDGGVDCDYIKVNSKAEWASLSQTLIEESRTGLRPILHFVCHGDKIDGMSIWEDSVHQYTEVLWGDLYSLFREINYNTHNNLFVSMCVCEAFWSMINLLSDERIPFTGIVASPDSVYAIDAEMRFPEFYVALLRNMNVQAAKQKLEDGYKDVAALIGENAAHILVKFSDELFLDAYRKETTKRKDPLYLRKCAIKAYATQRIEPNEENLEAYIEQYNLHYQDEYRKIRDTKFMFDIYPEERERFDFPDELTL